MFNVEDDTVMTEEMTDTEKQEALKLNEKSALGALLGTADYKASEDEIVTINIKRGDKVTLSFDIAPLSSAEYDRCREKHTKYKRNKQLGVRVPEDVDTVKHQSELIYQATIEKDRKMLWDNKEAWKELDLVNPLELIDRVLKAGEKAQVVEKIALISGFDDDMEDTAKN